MFVFGITSLFAHTAHGYAVSVSYIFSFFYSSFYKSWSQVSLFKVKREKSASKIICLSSSNANLQNIRLNYFFKLAVSMFMQYVL